MENGLRCINEFSMTASNHKLVAEEIRLCLRVNEKSNSSTEYNWLCHKQVVIFHSCSKQVKTLEDTNSEIDPNITYNNIITAHQPTAEKSFSPCI